MDGPVEAVEAAFQGPVLVVGFHPLDGSAGRDVPLAGQVGPVAGGLERLGDWDGSGIGCDRRHGVAVDDALGLSPRT